MATTRPIVSGRAAIRAGHEACPACGEAFTPDETLRMDRTPDADAPRPVHPRCYGR